MDGIINVLKPVGMTSADIVRWILKKTKAEKAGHMGTLDPGAAGVLPICIGKATRLAEYHIMKKKTYRVELTLGITTDTLDAFGTETSRRVPEVSQKDFAEALGKFLGDIEQEPPMYSAVRKNGKHLYEYARKGLEVVREKRLVTIHRLEIIEWIDELFPKVLFEVECSKGTYMRTLCQDIGEELGCGASMSFLLRLQAGKFTLESSYTLEEIDRELTSGDYSILLSVEWGLELPVVNLPPYRLSAFKNGLSTDIQVIGGAAISEALPVQVFCEDHFIGVGIWNNGCLYPNKVMC